MEDDNQQELQLLPSPSTIASSSRARSRSSTASLKYRPGNATYEPSLDLQLSISLRPIQQQPADCLITGSISGYGGDEVEESSCIEALKWQAAEQIRLATIEKAYAEKVRELSRREMELAQSEFARARHMWQRAREDVDKAERLKLRATRQIDSTCIEITCQSCRQKFRA